MKASGACSACYRDNRPSPICACAPLIPFGNGINGFGQLPVLSRDGITGIMCIEGKAHPVIHIGPVGVMPLLLGHKGNFGHKSKSLAEVRKLKFRQQLIVLFGPHSWSGFNS
jgi:hypothetical protein